MLLDEFLRHVPHHRRNGSGDYHASCPAHDDDQRDPTKFSLHISAVDDRLLLKCFGGCDTDAVLRALHLEPSDLFFRERPRANGTDHAPPEAVLTLEAFAERKRLPLAALTAEGWKNSPRGIVIPYRARDGALYRERYRASLRPGAGFRWDTQKGKPLIPFGRHRLDEAIDKGELFLFEGESDTFTAWWHGLPALGLPGNSAARALEAEDLAGIETLWIALEPGASGEGMARGVRERLKEFKWTGRAALLRLPVKDLSELHVVDPEHFRAVLQSAQDDALPLDGWVDPKDTSGLSGSDDAVEAVLAEHGDDEHAPVADPIPLGTLVRDAVAYINSGAKPEVLPTPFADLNALLDGGLRRGEITFIAAKTGIGKSAIALQIAVEVARHRYPVLLANFEMANRAVVQRILAQQARVSATGLRRNIVEPEDLERIRFTAPALAALPLVMTDAARTVRHLAKLVAARADTDPFALLVVDYLQVLAGPKSIRERRLQIDYINRALRRLAIKYHVAVLCVSSMRRLGKDEVPDLSALKESGDIEFGADCVIVLAREFQQHNATARILKQRHGREGEVDLVFDWQHVRFEEG